MRKKVVDITRPFGSPERKRIVRLDAQQEARINNARVRARQELDTEIEMENKRIRFNQLKEHLLIRRALGYTPSPGELDEFKTLLEELGMTGGTDDAG